MPDECAECSYVNGTWIIHARTWHPAFSAWPLYVVGGVLLCCVLYCIYYCIRQRQAAYRRAVLRVKTSARSEQNVDVFMPSPSTRKPVSPSRRSPRAQAGQGAEGTLPPKKLFGEGAVEEDRI